MVLSSAERSAVVNKVQKLLSLAEGTDSKKESVAAVKKAQFLLKKYNLTIFDIENVAFRRFLWNLKFTDHPGMRRKSESTIMKAEDGFALALELLSPWSLLSQRLDMNTNPFELYFEVGAERGAKYPCPSCGAMCNAHDFKVMTWRHLNFPQHHSYIIASVPRVKCKEHGTHRTQVPWSRPGSGFTLFFEQMVMSLAKEMSAHAVARFVGVAYHSIRRIIRDYNPEQKIL